MTWYYAEDGEQKGPVSEEELTGMVDSGGLATDALIWKQGMDDWVSYGSIFGSEPSSESVSCPTCGAQVQQEELIPAGDTQVCPNCRDTYAQGLKEGLSQPVSAPGTRGTGGQTPNTELRAMAREALTGKWGLGAGVSLLLFVLMIAIAFVPILGGLVQLIISGPLMFGFTQIFIRISRGEHVEVGMLFSGFSHFGISWLIYFVISLFAGLAALAAAIPGIILLIIGFTQMSGGGSSEVNPLVIAGFILAYIPALVVYFYMFLRYALAMFIAVDDPEVGTMQALNLSSARMKGRKKKLFFLGLSFIGWYFLGILSFFIGLFFVGPYIMTSIAAFYDDIGDAGESSAESGPGSLD